MRNGEKSIHMGSEIIKAKGRTHYGIATCVCHIADAIINQRPTILPVSSPLTGRHGIKGVALSLPSVVGPMGVTKRIYDEWTEEEWQCFLKSAETVRKILDSVSED